MSITQARLSEAQFMRLPDDGHKYELVEGEAKLVPTSLRHDQIGAIIVYRLTHASIGRGILCISQAGFRMRNGNIRCPDVSFMRKERLPGGEAPNTFGDAAPDLAIEIISPSEDEADMARKVGEYFASGAEQVWHVFPETQTVAVYTSPDVSRAYRSEDTLTGGTLLPDFACPVADLFILS